MKVVGLDGTWKLTWGDGPRSMVHAVRPEVDESGFIPASVPGEVHLDLERAGFLAAPEVGLNALAARWVEECRFYYRRSFELSARDAGARRAWMVFEQLDLHATIYLNGEVVGTHANAFRRCRLDVTDKLRPGRNVVAVDIHSGLLAVGELPGDRYGLIPRVDGSVYKRHWLRKPQYQFGWDWSTRLVNVGITGAVRLELSDDIVRLDDTSVRTEVSDDLRTGTVTASVVVEGLSREPTASELRLRVLGRSETALTVTVPEGLSRHELTVQVDDPELWWPRGHGPQHLHQVTVELVPETGPPWMHAATIGFRRVAVVQDPHPEGGRSFRMVVNHRPVFAKGANWVPPDLIPARADGDRYATLLDRALEANFNFLRVWGGGTYESDLFYELCDRHGILVWQDMAFACSWYPGDDPRFVAEVTTEIAGQVRRLACHPSLVVWCGNNEIDWIASMLGRQPASAPDHMLFHQTLGQVVADEDPTRVYVPTSPHSRDGEDPNGELSGDQHPWAVGFTNPDFRDYRTMRCRFPDEGGILGPVALPTVDACLPPAQAWIGSPAWNAHDNSIGLLTPAPGLGLADELLRFWTGADARSLSIEEFVYLGGLVQAEGLREYCEAFRRRMHDSSAAVFWMFNDAWPTTRSWVIVDYYLRRTPAFHHVRRALAPVHVTLAVDGDDFVVYGLNDTLDEVVGELRFGLFALDGALPLDLGADVRLAPNASTVLARVPVAEWRDPTSTLAFGVLTTDGAVIARNRLVLPRYQELAWAPPHVAVTSGDGVATFTSETFVWGVCLDLDGEADLADNLFDVYPGIPHQIRWDEPTPPRVLRTGNLVPAVPGS